MERIVLYVIDKVVAKNIRRIVDALEETDYMSHELFDRAMVEQEVILGIIRYWMNDGRHLHTIQSYIAITMDDGICFEYVHQSFDGLKNRTPVDQYREAQKLLDDLDAMPLKGINQANLSDTGQYLRLALEVNSA